jgi:hypothetical protein
MLPALSPGNVDKTTQAPVTVIIAYDTRFYELLPQLFPHRPEMANPYKASAALAETTAFRNGTLQGARLRGRRARSSDRRALRTFRRVAGERDPVKQPPVTVIVVDGVVLGAAVVPHRQ